MVNKLTKLVSTKLTSSNIATVMSLLSATPLKLTYLSRNLSQERLDQAMGEGERSFRQVLAHLLNAEARSSEAIYLALLAKEPLLIDIHPERQWGKLLQYHLSPFAELLAYFSFRRNVLLRVLTSLTEEEWARTIREDGKKRKESVYWRARSLALHELEHLTDIEGKISDADDLAA